LRCKLCEKTAVDEDRAAQAIFREVLRWCASEGLILGSPKPQLTLAEQSAMTGSYFDRRTLGLTTTVTRKSRGAETSVEKRLDSDSAGSAAVAISCGCRA
jgi:hypothetical protein